MKFFKIIILSAPLLAFGQNTADKEIDTSKSAQKTQTSVVDNVKQIDVPISAVDSVKKDSTTGIIIELTKKDTTKADTAQAAKKTTAVVDTVKKIKSTDTTKKAEVRQKQTTQQQVVRFSGFFKNPRDKMSPKIKISIRTTSNNLNDEQISTIKKIKKWVADSLAVCKDTTEPYYELGAKKVDTDKGKILAFYYSLGGVIGNSGLYDYVNSENVFNEFKERVIKKQ